MRFVQDGGCILIVVASVAMAAWQTDFGTGRAESAMPRGSVKQVDERMQSPVDRAVWHGPLLKA